MRLSVVALVAPFALCTLVATVATVASVAFVLGEISFALGPQPVVRPVGGHWCEDFCLPVLGPIGGLCHHRIRAVRGWS